MNRMLSLMAREAREWCGSVISNLPGYTGIILRRWVIRWNARTAGIGIRVATGVEIRGLKNIDLGNRVSMMRQASLFARSGTLSIGDYTTINNNSTVDAEEGGEIRIGDQVMIARNVVVRASDHAFLDPNVSIRLQGHVSGKIVIEDGCWIASNVVVTRNVTIGRHSVVGAGAVVTKDIEPYSIVGGVPAKLIRKRISTGSPEADCFQ